VTKRDFLLKWAKKATANGAVEAFERDVETLMKTTIRMSVSAVVNGVIDGASKREKKSDRALLEDVARQIPIAVEEALRKLYQ
jgi:hypothetical protein